MRDPKLTVVVVVIVSPVDNGQGKKGHLCCYSFSLKKTENLYVRTGGGEEELAQVCWKHGD